MVGVPMALLQFESACTEIELLAELSVSAVVPLDQLAAETWRVMVTGSQSKYSISVLAAATTNASVAAPEIETPATGVVPSPPPVASVTVTLLDPVPMPNIEKVRPALEAGSEIELTAAPEQSAEA
jgi:hypothetical protein